MELPVADGERVQLVPVRAGDRRRGVGIEAAAQQNDGAAASDPAGVGTPDVLVHLQLQPHGQSVFENPGRQIFRASTPCTGENRTAAQRPGERVLGDDVLRELVVGAIAG